MRQKKNSNKGFTLIELLVVIAIIGVLASVVLASLNTARTKGVNTNVKSNLNSIRNAAELYHATTGNGSYTGFCASAKAVEILANAATNGGGTAGTATNDCNETANTWAAYSVLKAAEGTFTTWCVDSTNKSKGQTAANVTALGTTGTACL